MTTMREAPATRVTLPNVLAHYYDDLQRCAAVVREGRAGSRDSSFTPPFALPPLTPALERFYSAAEVGITPLGEYRGTELVLLDLMRNPRTRTTKTVASLTMVARAVEHIHRTSEPVMLLTPSSANKATALRNAVYRAIECGLVDSRQLRIVSIVPKAAVAKVWASPLSTDPELASRNPVLVYPGADRAGVKTLARAVADDHADDLYALTGTRLWYSLDIDNYRMADAVRALAEAEFLPPREERLHAHSVSSAYGLLGHHLGRELVSDVDPARYFLVQHLDTPDMVLSLLFGTTDRSRIPEYTVDGCGLYTQTTDPRFPATTYEPNEVLDPTFYTRRPPTSEVMNRLVREHGGGGIVVSLHECLLRYPYLRWLLAPAGIALPADPRRLREWSLVMALTGVLNAIDRELIREDQVVVHGSGSYSEDDYTPIAGPALRTVTTPCDVRGAVFHAALVGSCG